jgi:hypothetical protein
MPRNGTGTFSLVAGNPFITGSVISSTTMNNTLSDIATALTASVANDGQTPITANQSFGGFNLTNVGTLGATTVSATTLGASGTSTLGVANITTLAVVTTATVPTAGTTDNTTEAANTAWVRTYAPSSTYTPTTSNNSGVLTASPGYGLYMRVGNIVHVSVRIPTTPTTSTCSFQFSLPIASNIAAVSEIVGMGYSLNSLVIDPVAVQGVVANPGRVAANWSSSGTSAGYANFNFSYEVH